MGVFLGHEEACIQVLFSFPACLESLVVFSGLARELSRNITFFPQMNLLQENYRLRISMRAKIVGAICPISFIHWGNLFLGNNRLSHMAFFHYERGLKLANGSKVKLQEKANHFTTPILSLRLN